MLLFILLTAAPVPKGPKPVYIAPMPRVMSVWVDANGNERYYSREYFDSDGRLRRRVYEGDQQAEQYVPILPASTPGIHP